MRAFASRGLVPTVGLLALLQGGCLLSEADVESGGRCGPRDLTPECCLKTFPGDWERCTGAGAGASTSLGMKAAAATLVVPVAILPVINPAERRGVALAEDLRTKVEKALVACARRAERQVNDIHFQGRSPSRELCEQLKTGEQTTWAMYLGLFKHAEAGPCLHEALNKLLPGRYLLQPRFQLNPRTGQWEYLDGNQVSQIVAREGWKGLAGTIEPDVVLMDDTGVIIHVYDLKFPCPENNPAQWTFYKSGRWRAYLQNELYREALGVKPVLVSPRWGIGTDTGGMSP